jgi:transcription antitermination factor NusG
LSEIAQQKIAHHADGAETDSPAEKQVEAKWLAVYTTPRHEKRVSQHLSLRGIEHYLPLYRTQRRWSDGSKVTLDLPLFPGYLFVHIIRSERVPVLQVPGVLSFVGGTGRQPAWLPEAEIDALRAGLSLRRPEPHPLLTVGQRARIRSGALAGMEGVVVRRKNSLRVVLTMDLIQQSVAVEVSEAELETVDSKGPSRARDSSTWSGPRPEEKTRVNPSYRSLS